jgi:hypothetical protein
MSLKQLTATQLNESLQLFNDLLSFRGSEKFHLVVCGGSALIALGLIPRATKDVDILAINSGGVLSAPVPIPPTLLEVAKDVQKSMSLPEDWFNNGPSSNEGGLFQMGLPDLLQERLVTKKYGENLTISYIGRLDQIYFKLWASVDRGGYHVEDLMALSPTQDELYDGAMWTMQKDVSEGYRMVLKQFLKAIGFENVSNKIT